MRVAEKENQSRHCADARNREENLMRCRCTVLRACAAMLNGRRLGAAFATLAIAFLAFLPVATSVAYAQETTPIVYPTVTTDKFDYQPAEVVQISGSGFFAGETVTLQVLHMDATPPGGEGHDSWSVTADSSGAITAQWFVEPDDSLGSWFVLTAVGEDPIRTANTVFTDGVNPVSLPQAACPTNLNSCTANDVTTTVKAVQILKVCVGGGHAGNTCTSNADCSASEGGNGVCQSDSCNSLTDTIDLRITTQYASTANQRYDLGLFVSGDGGSVQEPSTANLCYGAAAQAGQGNNLAYPDADTDLFLSLDPAGHSDTPNTPDTCGDLDATAGPVDWTTDVKVACNIAGGNLVIPSCRVWEQNANHKESCQTLQQAGTGSKCDCTPLTVTADLNPCAVTTCNDNDLCTNDSCNVINKVCQNGTNNGTACTTDEQCTGGGNCGGGEAQCVYTPGNSGTVCRASAGVCDVADTCDGVNAGCTDNKQPATTICRAAAGACDVAESCTGSSNDCPANLVAPATTICRASAGACDVAESCTGSSAVCPADAFKPSTTECRASGGVCDLAESCTGSGADCPADAKKPATTECRASAGVCDVAESCTGSSNDCPTDVFKPATTECRAAGGVCDVAESCTGSSAACPADVKKPATTECRASAGVCDVAESCTGSSNDCPADVFKPKTTECRGVAGACDVAESCPGDSAACPADVKRECALVTDSALCLFDRGDQCGANTKQFNLNFSPAVDVWPGYKVNSTNPGQFYFNGFAPGPGTVKITVPWPYVSQGAQPVHVYDGTTVTVTNCVNLNTPALVACPATISANDWATGVPRSGDCSDGLSTWSVACESVPPSTLPNKGSYTCEVTINFTKPSSGLAYINMHLDYGLKGQSVDMNPIDGTADRYDAGANLTIGGYDALQDNTTQNGPVAIDNCTAYPFVQQNGGTFSDTVYNWNVFKKIAGVFGREHTSSDGNGVANAPVSLYRSSTKTIVASGKTDEDGYYLLPYKHTGKAENYTVTIGTGATAVSKVVQLKANGWAEASYDATTRVWFTQVVGQ
jgi:hypothetical protein